jgi:hypothetical protein
VTGLVKTVTVRLGGSETVATGDSIRDRALEVGTANSGRDEVGAVGSEELAAFDVVIVVHAFSVPGVPSQTTRHELALIFRGTWSQIRRSFPRTGKPWLVALPCSVISKSVDAAWALILKA